VTVVDRLMEELVPVLGVAVAVTVKVYVPVGVPLAEFPDVWLPPPAPPPQARHNSRSGSVKANLGIVRAQRSQGVFAAAARTKDNRAIAANGRIGFPFLDSKGGGQRRVAEEDAVVWTMSVCDPVPGFNAGDKEQVALAGAPEQARLTGRSKPLIGFTVMV
jgi:hypothetical protein